MLTGGYRKQVSDYLATPLSECIIEIGTRTVTRAVPVVVNVKHITGLNEIL